MTLSIRLPAVLSVRWCGVESTYQLGAPEGGRRLKYIKAIFYLCSLVLIASCSSSSANRENQVKHRFSTIAIVSKDELVSVDAIDKYSLGKTEGMVAGGATGAMGGALAGAAACAPTGPYAALCVAVAVVPGAIAGMLGGAVAANELWFRGISQENELYLREEASHVSGNRDLNGELVLALKEKLPAEITKPAAQADVQVMPIIKGIAFVATEDELLQLKVSAALVFSEVGEVNSTRKGYFSFSAKSERKSIDGWLTEDGSAMENAMDSCLGILSDKMAKLVQEKRSQ